jgi:hypothetical protein
MLQTRCLIGTEGHKWMNLYDMLPYDVRVYLMECEFNLCMACLGESYLHRYGRTWRRSSCSWSILEIIREMECWVKDVSIHLGAIKTGDLGAIKTGEKPVVRSFLKGIAPTNYRGDMMCSSRLG